MRKQHVTYGRKRTQYERLGNPDLEEFDFIEVPIKQVLCLDNRTVKKFYTSPDGNRYTRV